MAKMKRTLCVTTVTRGDETDVRVGNFSAKTLLKEGWTIVRSELVECSMSLEDFYKYSAHDSLSASAHDSLSASAHDSLSASAFETSGGEF